MSVPAGMGAPLGGHGGESSQVDLATGATAPVATGTVVPGAAPAGAPVPGPGPTYVAPAVPAPWRLRTVANGVTMARLAATPLLILLILNGTPSWAALLVWAALSFSDFVDGWVARRRGPSPSGAFLDPLADKFLVLGALVAIVALGKVGWEPVALLAAREFLITTYRVVVARQGISVPARRMAKAKTVVEFITVGMVLLPVAWPSRLTYSHAALWLAVVLAWASGAQYLMDSRAGRRPVATGA